MLKCGMAEVDLEPPLGLAIPGYFTRRNATGYKDSLFVKSMVLKKDEEMMAIIVGDSLCVDRETVIDIRKKVFLKTGIKGENVMISSTHTHTGTPVLSRYSGEGEEKYIKIYCEKAADSAKLALDKMTGARIGFGMGKEEDISFNRRFYMKDGTFKTNPGVNNPLIERAEGGIDPSVTVMRIEDTAGRIMGIVSNFSCHPDVVGGNQYSADYPGELSSTLKTFYGKDVVSLFINGACGNINHINVYGEPIDKKRTCHYKKMGRILGAAVMGICEKITCEDTDDMDMEIKSEIFRGKIRRPSPGEIEEADNVLKDGDTSERDRMFASHVKNFDYSLPEYAPVEVQVARIGKFTISGFPGEVFVEFSDKIKKNSPFKYNIVNYLANGNYGYLVTKKAYRNGGYEPRITSRPRVAVSEGYEMTNRIIKILRSMS